MTKFFLQNEDGSHRRVSEAEFRRVYGAFVIRNLTAEVPGWRIAALKDIIDAPAGTSVFVMDESSTPLALVPVQMYYSTAPLQPGSAPPNGLPPGVTARGDVGETDERGHSGWSWGDAYYFPQDPDPSKRKGPYCYWIPDGKPCESIDGVGMIGDSNHRRYDIYIEYARGGEPIPSGPGCGEETIAEIRGHLAAIEAILERCDDD